MSAMASLTTGVSVVCSAVCSGTDQSRHHSSASLAFVRGIHRSPVDSPNKEPVTQKMLILAHPDPKGHLGYAFRFELPVAWLPFRFSKLRPRQNGRHLPDVILKCIFLNENGWISLNFLLKFISNVPTDNIPILVQIMARRLPGDKPLSERMMVILLTHICVARPQWVKSWYGFLNAPRPPWSVSQICQCRV